MSSQPTEEDGQVTRARINRWLQDFRAAQKANVHSWQQNHEVPRRLYHYTTMAGLMGITTTSRMWASDVRYMNDASEIQYAADLINGVVATAMDGVADEKLREVLPRRRGFPNWFEYGVQPFIACFCEEGDLLSQWRGYGRGNPLAALGFDLSILASFGGLPSNTFLRKVAYDQDEQRKSVENVVRTWLETAEALLGTDGEEVEPSDLFPYPAIWALQEALAEHHLASSTPLSPRSENGV